MTPPSEPRACPFCGSRATILNRPVPVRFVACLDCGAEGGSRRTEEEAIAAWNRRAGEGK